MDFSAVCRLCLGCEYLTPIFTEDDEKCSYAVFITTGIKVRLMDGLPDLMCINCMECMNRSLRFRKTCTESQKRLMEVKKELEEKKYGSISNTEESGDVSRDARDVKIEIDLELFQFKVNDAGIKVDEESSDDEKPLANLLDSFDAGDAIAADEDQVDVADAEGKCASHYLIKCKKIEKKIIKIQHGVGNESEVAPAGRPFFENFAVSDTNKRVTCHLCQKTLSLRSIDAHMSCRHPGIDDRRDKCELCDKYILKSKLNRHKKLMHGVLEMGDGIKSYKCGYCKREYEMKEALLEHVPTCGDKKKKRKVNEKERRMTSCDVCHKSMQKASLRMHKAIKHSGLGPVCEHCGKMFGNRFRLNEHCRAKHGYEKFKCNYCEFQSAGVVAMRNHERRHRGEKPFVCETCGSKFHAAYLLAQHKQSHRTEKLIKCDLCSASFKANNSLHMHKITCHSKCIYKCFLCERTYNCRHYVVKHLRHFHDYKEKVGQLEKIYEITNGGDAPKNAEE